MFKKLAELQVIKRADWNDSVIKALQDAGLTVILEYNGMSEDRYIIAEGNKNADNNWYWWKRL